MRFMRALFALIIFTAMTINAQASGSQMPYYIEVDSYNNIVTVYSTADKSIVRQMICSTGTGRWLSPHGTFTMPKQRKSGERDEWYTFEDGYGKYGSRIKGNYLFHSYLFNSKNDNDVKLDSYAELGTDASHGCVRLYIEDAKWIAYNCFAGTKVKVYEGKVRYDYLKEKLYEQTFTIDSGLTYAEWMSLPQKEGDLGYASSGDAVKALQSRMKALGLYSGDINGRYDEFMVYNVKAIQNVLGLPVTGVANAEFRELIYSDGAPVSLTSTLNEGANGPSVKVVQIMLTQLGLYTGDISGKYDADTEQAVIMFQRYCGYKETGVATGALQADMASRLSELENEYGAGNFSVYFEDESAMYGVVNSSSRLNVRESKSTQSEIIAKIDKGSRIPVAAVEGEWLKLVNGDNVGYVSAEFVNVTTETKRMPKYRRASAANPGVEVRIADSITVIGVKKVSYGIANTSERLFIRKNPSSTADPAFMVMPGTRLKVLSTKDSWAYISYGGRVGYTRKGMLDIFEVTELTTVATTLGAKPSEFDNTDIEDDTIYAIVSAESGADVYSAASATAEVRASLDKGERLRVALAGETWTQVTNGEITGYILNDDIITGVASELDEYEFSVSARLAVVNTGSAAKLNMRSAPSKEADVLQTLPNGTIVEIIADSGEWREVRLGMQTGYIMADFLEDFNGGDD